jgi:hypothetical protein
VALYLQESLECHTHWAGEALVCDGRVEWGQPEGWDRVRPIENGAGLMRRIWAAGSGRLTDDAHEDVVAEDGIAKATAGSGEWPVELGRGGRI